MLRFAVLILLMLYGNACLAQMKQGQARLDSLLAEVPKMKEDTNRVQLMEFISGMYNNINPDEGLKWAAKELALAQKIGWRKGEGFAYNAFGNNYINKGAYPEALEAFFKALSIAEERSDKQRVGFVSGNIGNVYFSQKDYPKALEYYFQSLKIAEEGGDKRRTLRALGSIGNVYNGQGKHDEAIEYKKKSLAIAEFLNDKQGIIVNTGNLGATYANLHQYNAALAFQFKALRVAEEMGDKRIVSVNLGNIGLNYYNIATDSAGIKPDSLVPARREANLAKAVEYLNKGIADGREMRFLEAIPEFSTGLSQAYARQGDYKAALAAYKQSITVRDSLFNKDNDAKLIRTEEGYKLARVADSVRLEGEKRQLAIRKEAQLAALRAEYAKKQAAAKTDAERQQLIIEEAAKAQQLTAGYKQAGADAEAAYQRKAALDRKDEEARAALAAAELKRQKTIAGAAIGGGVLMLLIAAVGFRAFRQRRASNVLIAGEQQRSESLLRNILPADVAEELKEGGVSVARSYDAVSILYTDFVDFTGTAEKLTPQQLVRELHECFSAFDRITEKRGLEKIKTIGDAYMAVCGLPQSDPRHAQNCVAAALDIRDFIEERRRKERVFEIRIGVHSGPVIAGIVGVKKFAYDIWGSTVETAAKMEGFGSAGKVNISDSTYELVREEFACTPNSRAGGDVAMYFVETPVKQKG